MLNIIRMDFARMMRPKSQYILWIVMAGLLILTTATMGSGFRDPKASAENWATIQDQAEESAENLGMYVTIPTKPGEKATLYDLFYGNVQGKVEAIFVVIFAVLFATSDIRCGYIKNIGGQCKRRSSLVLSKAVNLLIYTVLTFVIALLVQAVSNQIFFGYLEIGPVSELSAYVAVQILLHYALALIVMAIAIMISNNLISMTLAILMCMNMTMLLYAMIEKGIHSLFDKNVDLVTHTVTGSISFLQAHGSSDALFKASLVAVIYGVVFTTVSALVFQRRDIR